MSPNDTNTLQAIKLRNLWIATFTDIFHINSKNIKSKIIEPKDKEELAEKLIQSNPEHVKLSSGSGAFRVEYNGDESALKNLFIKGYYHKRLFDPTNLYKRFSVAKLTLTQLCISNTRIFNEIIMNYLMKKITETDTTIDDKDKNNIHTYEFIYTPNKNTVYIAQPAIGHKALIAGDNTVTTLKELLEAYYKKLKEDIATPRARGKHDTSLDDINRIAVSLCNVLIPYLETLQKLRKKYKFVHTDLHFGNIFIKSKSESEQNPVFIFQNELKKPVKEPLQKKLDPTIHEQLINDLENCVLLIADYDLARMTVNPEIFNSPTMKYDVQFPGINDIDFKSIFIEGKAIEENAFGVNVVPKENKKLQKKETVIRTRCAYEEYLTTYKDLYPTNMEDKKYADMLIYSNWDILSIFINVMAFLKKCEYKIYNGPVTYKKEMHDMYLPIITLFQSYVVNPISNKNPKHYIIGNNIITYFYACMNYMYRDKSLGNWLAFLFKGKFSFITRVFDKFKNDYHDNGIFTATYISNSEGPKGSTIFKKLKNIVTRKAKQGKTSKVSHSHKGLKSHNMRAASTHASTPTSHTTRASTHASRTSATHTSHTPTTRAATPHTSSTTHTSTTSHASHASTPMHTSTHTLATPPTSSTTHTSTSLPLAVTEHVEKMPFNTATIGRIKRKLTTHTSTVPSQQRQSSKPIINKLQISSISSIAKKKLQSLLNSKSKKATKSGIRSKSSKSGNLSQKKIFLKAANKSNIQQQIKKLNVGTGVKALRAKFEALAKVNKL